MLIYELKLDKLFFFGYVLVELVVILDFEMSVYF